MAQSFPLPLNTSQSPTQVFSDASTALQTLQSTFSGSSAPTTPTPVAGQIYHDTDDGQQYWYDGTVWHRVRPRLAEDFAVTGNVAPSSTIKTATIPAGFFRNNGARVHIEASGEFVSSANSKTMDLEVAGTSVALITQLSAGTPETVRISGYLVRTDATTAKAFITVIQKDFFGTTLVSILDSSVTIAPASTTTVEIVGDVSSGDDVIVGNILTLDGAA